MACPLFWRWVHQGRDVSSGKKQFGMCLEDMTHAELFNPTEETFAQVYPGEDEDE
jgi:hypothetical protein